MNKEQAEKIANQIMLLADAVAATRISIGWENAPNAAHNQKIADGLKTGLVNLLSDNPSAKP